MREIEIKARIVNKEALMAKLASLDVQLSKPMTQHDRVYSLPGVVGGASNSAPWLRIRTETKNGLVKHYFTLKKSVTSQLDSIEHETIVEDDKELDKIIEHIGFVPYSDVTKTRQKAMFGNIEICVDRVDLLGDFIELEKLVDESADYKAVFDELWELFDKLGVLKRDEVMDGYDVMMKNYLEVA